MEYWEEGKKPQKYQTNFIRYSNQHHLQTIWMSEKNKIYVDGLTITKYADFDFIR